MKKSPNGTIFMDADYKEARQNKTKGCPKMNATLDFLACL